MIEIHFLFEGMFKCVLLTPEGKNNKNHQGTSHNKEDNSWDNVFSKRNLKLTEQQIVNDWEGHIKKTNTTSRHRLQRFFLSVFCFLGPAIPQGHLKRGRSRCWCRRCVDEVVPPERFFVLFLLLKPPFESLTMILHCCLVCFTSLPSRKKRLCLEFGDFLFCLFCALVFWCGRNIKSSSQAYLRTRSEFRPKETIRRTVKANELMFNNVSKGPVYFPLCSVRCAD